MGGVSLVLKALFCNTDCMIENIPQEQLPTIQPIPNPPKVWLPFVIALVVVALVSGGGVYLWQQNQQIELLQRNQIVAQPTIVSYATPTKIQPQAVSESQITLGDISLIVPNKWKVESNDSKSARILTDYPNYKVELLVSLENSNLTESNYKSSFDNTKTKYGEAFKVAQGGAFNVTGVKINGKLYSFSWEIASNEPTPSNLDGIWNPKHNVTESDIWNMTISSKPVNQATNQDTRIELTADGWNKKLLAELNKGDNCSNFFETRFSAKPNTFVTYTSSEFKYSVNFPYNAT